ncbi:hypothetical protein COX68_01320, partial [Candidatus Falkowbacteria bacterium CG_4_10_14_0_2_um_filter_41_15]
KYIKDKKHVSANELVDYLGISRQALFKHHLAKLIDDHVLVKNGRPPKVYYSIATPVKLEIKEKSFNINNEAKNLINHDFLIITPAGERKEGLDGFIYWCQKNNLPLEKTTEEYLKTFKKYEKYKKDGLIDSEEKLKSTFKNVFLDKLFYIDFYSIERFGKTKLGQLLLYAKQSQNKKLMQEIVGIIKPNIDKIIKKFKIDGVGFIPPTVKRETQLMKVLEKGLNLHSRKVEIIKIKTAVAVPQKTLNKLVDRIENAKNTIIVSDNSSFNNILLIDDAVGSGATLNETAKKIRDKKMCQGKIIGITITGSFNGFDVISEV